jgi:hypothetical protein
MRLTIRTCAKPSHEHGFARWAITTPGSANRVMPSAFAKLVSMDVPKILLTNDDGWDAPGLEALKALAAELGEVYVLAPRDPHSYAGHRVTTDAALFSPRLRRANSR